MLDKLEQLELIRQSEKSNLTKEEEEILMEWAIRSKIDTELLSLLFKGCIEVNKIEGKEPAFTITAKGKEVMAQEIDDDDEYIDEEYEDENYPDCDEDHPDPDKD